MGIWGKCMHLEVHPASRFEARAMSTLLVTSVANNILCLANRVFASAPGSQSPEYNILVAICCNCLFFLVSSVLLLALATATPVAPRGHSYCTRASLLLQLCRLMSLRTSQLAGIVRFGTLSNINALIIIVNIIIIIIIIIFIGYCSYPWLVGGGCHPVTAVTRFSKVSHGKGKWRKF